MTDLAFLTATELAPLIKSKQLSPVELTNHMLNRINQIDPMLHTYITPLPDLALKQARQAELDIIHGKYRGPLHGIPVGIKDNNYTKGIKTTVGSKLFDQFIPSQNATIVDKLLGKGAIMLGKQNMHELAAGSTGTNHFYGDTQNPWKIGYMPGGSSGGGAASLSAGLATLATGTDTFGSIRLPAAMCGVYGLKPTYGLVSTHGIFPSAGSLDTAGPIARSVSDIALMLNNMASYDHNDPVSLKLQTVDYTKNLNQDIKGLKMAVPTYYLQDLEPEIESHFLRAIETFRFLGAKIEEIDIPELTMAPFAGYLTVTGEAANLHHQWLQTDSEAYSRDIRTFFLAGSLTNSSQYIKAQQARRKLTEAFKTAFDTFDIMLAPTIPFTTKPYSTSWLDQNLATVNRALPFTVPINLTGLPSLAVPMALDGNGMPTGMQLIGNHLSEELLLQIGKTWEDTEPLTSNLKTV